MRSAAVFAVVVAVSVGAVFVGRAEGRHAVAAQERQLLRVRADVGSRFPRPDYTTHDPVTGFTCLAYANGERVLALELCFDPERRLVEAVDRRVHPEHIASVRWLPPAAPWTVSAGQLDAILRRRPPVPGLLP